MEGIVEEDIIETVPITTRAEMDMNIDDTTTIIDTALDQTILATATMVKMILLTNVIIILILVHALVRKNHDIQDADHVITVTRRR